MANEILKVGFPTNDEVTVEEHFGHCEKFVVYSVNSKERGIRCPRACSRSISKIYS